MNIEQKTESKKEEKQIIPDQLNITIRTSIPGFQKIEYKPSMTIKDSDSKGVQFDPLIKLDKSKINNIPQEYRVKQFFNRGLFQSLLNFNGVTPVKSLTYATRTGIIDNNIKVTLDTIFPVNSVIYIGKNPYAIGDVQWTTGDWKIEVKQKKEEIDISKITDPRLYSQLVREEIISGEQQLNELPESVLVGNNYSGPPVASGIKKQQTTSNLIPAATKSSTTTFQPKLTTNVPTLQTLTESKETPTASKETSSKIIPEILPPPASVSSTNLIEPSLPKPMLQLEDKPSTKVEELSPEEEKIFESLKMSLKTNWRSKVEFTDFFLSDSFYSVANNIYLRLSKKNQTDITNFYKLVTQPQNYKPGVNLSKSMYDALCNLVSIIETPSDGNCFFAAVANGINIYNYENQAHKIIYNIYGKTQLFTINVLREIVLSHYNSLTPEQKEDLNVIALSNLDNLNKQFNDSVSKNNPQTNDEYLERLNYIYTINENFLVYKPLSVPIDVDDYSRPFRILTEGEIPNYIKSKNYWGDEFSMKAICNILGIYIIPIEKTSKKFKSKSKSINLLNAILREPYTIKDICSKKILFLYKKNLHYELIRFKYLSQVLTLKDFNKKLEIIGKWYTIFDKNNYPPYHILLLLYGSSYIKIDNKYRDDYNIYPQIMKEINLSVIKNVGIKNTYFINTFNVIFNLKNSIANYAEPYLQRDYSLQKYQGNKTGGSEEEEEFNMIEGGQPPYRYPTYPPYGYPSYPPPYGYPPYRSYGYPGYQNRYITKKADDTKIAYSITIDMEVHPGTSLTPEQINESKCNSKYNAIRKAFSEFTGKPYVIPPVYKPTQSDKPKVNNTRRITVPNQTKMGDRRNITMKRR
jgi:hypothetical protein